MDYPNAKFLIYNCWENDNPYKIAGSLLLDGAFTEEEAKEKIEVYKIRHDEFETKFPSTYPSRTRFTYIVNRSEWWTNYKPSIPRANVSSLQVQVEHHPLASQ
jgi:hypothetical protein